MARSMCVDMVVACTVVDVENRNAGRDGVTEMELAVPAAQIRSLPLLRFVTQWFRQGFVRRPWFLVRYLNYVTL